MTTEHIRAQYRQWLDQRWTDVYANQQGALIVPHIHKTACFVEVSGLPDGLHRVNIHAPVLRDVSPTTAMYQYVASHTGDFYFGSLSLYFEHHVPPVAIEFEHSLIAEQTTAEQLNYFVALIANTANTLTERLRPLFGGQGAYEH